MARVNVDSERQIFKKLVMATMFYSQNFCQKDYWEEISEWNTFHFPLFDVSNHTTNYSTVTTYVDHYNPSVRIIDLVSHTTYVVCINFIHKCCFDVWPEGWTLVFRLKSQHEHDEYIAFSGVNSIIEIFKIFSLFQTAVWW